MHISRKAFPHPSNLLKLPYKNLNFILCFLEFLGDLKNENSVLEWVLNSDNRELDDAIEAVNMKMLNKLLQSSPFMAVFFCKFYHQTLFFL